MMVPWHYFGIILEVQQYLKPYKHNSMKQSLLAIFFLASIFLFACKKDDPNPNNTGIGGTTSVRYEFTADVAAAYKLSTLTGTLAYDETISASTWSKTVSSPPKTAASETANLIVYAPDAWQNTQNQANVTLKIFVNNVEKATKSFVLIWLDRGSAFQLKATY